MKKPQASKKRKTVANAGSSQSSINSFFKQREPVTMNVNEAPLVVNEEHVVSNVEHVEVVEEISQPDINIPCINVEQQQQQQTEVEVDLKLLERDPALRTPISEYPFNQRDAIRKAYIKMGAYQPKLPYYKGILIGTKMRHFQRSWFAQWKWLEYSPSTHKAYCFPCYLFQNNPFHNPAFVKDGFNGWNRVNGPEYCAFVSHYGVPNSPHQKAENSLTDLMNVKGHIDTLLNRIIPEEAQRNRLRLKTTIESVRWLSMQACGLRGHDESASSSNRGNLIEMITLLRKMNPDIDAVVLEKAPKNATYVSSTIQKEVLHILSDMVRQKIRSEIGDAKFSILVDEAKDTSDKEQMAIVLRFVDAGGFIRERFFDIVRVKDTTAATLKASICAALGRYNLQVHDIRGQGYDGASNMRGSWNGLQAQFLREAPHAYYVHCFAHRLQLALVAAAENEVSIWDFFSKLSSIINIIKASPKRVAELHDVQVGEVERMVESGELDTGRGANQIGSLQRAGKTRWSSHFDSICSLVDMYGSVAIVLEKIMDEGATNSIRGEAAGNLKAMKTFEFIFILHLMHKIMGITYLLCQALQGDSLDILNAIACVSTTRKLLQDFRDEGFDVLLEYVKLFCQKHQIDIPDMEDRYKSGRACQRNDFITFEHHYRVDIFHSAIDFQVEEIASRFNDDSMELLRLSAALEPKNDFESFNVDQIYSLAETYYYADFSEMELKQLKLQLQHYGVDVASHETPHELFKNLSTLSELCRRLVETHKSTHYHLIDRLIRLVLTLPVSTATTERAFSAMKLVKTVLRNKMGDEYLADSMAIYIERELAQDIDCELVIDEFNKRKPRRVQLQ